MDEPNKRYILKNGVLMEAELAERMGVEGEELEIEQWIDDGDLAEAVLGISPERAAAIRDEVPE